MLDVITYALLRKQIASAASGADWEQNDPTADDYIKNRPFYTDETKKTVNVPEQKITIPSETIEVELVLPELIEFVPGQTYEVKWDDKTYSCVAFDMGGIGVIGNQDIFGGGTDTGEPFVMMISKAEGMGVVVAPGAIGTHTVEVFITKVVTLDKKYLPDLGLAPVATSGSYYDLKNAPAVYSDVVRYDTGQSLSATQKRQARNNIGAVSSDEVTGVVKYTTQNLTDAQKTRARTNIGAGTSSFSGSYNDLTDIIVGETYTYQSITINNITISSDTTIPDNVKFEQIIYQTTWKVKWSSSTSTFSLKLDKISRASNYYKYSSSSNSSYGLNVYDNGKIRCFAPTGVYYVNVTFDSIAVSTDIQLDEKYIPDTIQRVANMPTDHITYTAQALTEGQQKQARTNIGAGTSNFSGSYNDLTEAPIIDTTLTAEGAIADAKAVGNAVTKLIEQKADKSELEKLNTPKDYITLIDQVNGYHYIACMRDGNFVTYCATKSIEITAMPTKIEYTTGEYFDPTGMTVVATAYDGTTKEITDFIYPSSYILDSDTFIEIKYIEAGITHIATVPITVNPFNPAIILVDFDYTDNGDGTYTITGWKGTYNGEASTEIIIPNNGLIKV